MEEPIYIRQVQQDFSLHKEWLEKRADESKAEGCTFARVTWHPQDPSILLFEGWKERPADQGEARFQLRMPYPEPSDDLKEIIRRTEELNKMKADDLL